MAATATANRNPTDRNADATLHISHLHDDVTDAILWELMLQAAPVRHVYIPRDRITGAHYGYGFCEFLTPLHARYAAKILNLVKLFSKSLRISQTSIDRRAHDVGANLYIGNLVDDVDEKLLSDTFSAFGPLLDAPYIMRDPATGISKRFGFVKYGTFDHADAAIAAMDGQYICNAAIAVQYAFKKDADAHERHGSQPERIMAAKAADARRNANIDRGLQPHTLFADRPPAPTPAQLLPPAPSVVSQPSSVHALQHLATVGVPPYVPLPVPPPPPPHAYAYAAQGYTGEVSVPQWQQEVVAGSYSDAPPAGVYAHGQTAPVQASVTPSQVYALHPSQNRPPTTQLGWSANRHGRSQVPMHAGAARPREPHVYADPRLMYGHAHAHPVDEQPPPQAPGAMTGTPRLVPDESAPTAPRRAT